MRQRGEFRKEEPTAEQAKSAHSMWDAQSSQPLLPFAAFGDRIVLFSPSQFPPPRRKVFVRLGCKPSPFVAWFPADVETLLRHWASLEMDEATLLTLTEDELEALTDPDGTPLTADQVAALQERHRAARTRGARLPTPQTPVLPCESERFGWGGEVHEVGKCGGLGDGWRGPAVMQI